MIKLTLILSFAVWSIDGNSQNKSTIAKIDRIVKSIESDKALTKTTEKGKFAGYVSKENDTTWVPFENVYYFKHKQLVKVVSTDFRIHQTNTRTILYFNRDSLIKIEEGFVLGNNPFFGGKAYYVKDTSIYRDGGPFEYKTKKYFDSNDVETAKYYQTKAKDLITKNRDR